MQKRIYSEQLIPYMMSLGPYTTESANIEFCKLINIDTEIGQFVKNIIESIPSEKLEFDIQTLIINFLKASIEKDAIGLIRVIYSNYELISNSNNILFNIIMDFYISILSDSDIELINGYSSNCEFNIFEMVQAIRMKEKLNCTSLENFLDRLAKNKTCKKIIQKNTGINLQKIQQQYTICNLCKKNAKFQCGKCNITRYCSKQCQCTDWARHKKICKTLSFEK
jgi:hypothetical protein